MCIPPDRGLVSPQSCGGSTAMLTQGFRAPTPRRCSRAPFRIRAFRALRVPPAWTWPLAAHHNTCPNTGTTARRGGIDMAQGGETPNERLVRVFLETLSSGDLDALRPQIHVDGTWEATGTSIDRKSTRLNSSHVKISYAVFCLKK